VKPRIAIIGAGWVVEHAYAEHLAAHVDVAVVYDKDVARAEAIASRLGASHASTVAACLSPEIDGVLLAVPPHAHEALLPEALAASKFVLCEKPVFRDRASASLVTGPHGLRVMGSATTRLRADVQELLGWVERGSIGRVERMHLAWRRGAGVPAPGSWRTDVQRAKNGVLDDLGPHLLDVAAAVLRPDDRTEVVRARFDGSGGRPARGASWFRGGERPGDVCSVPVDASAVLESESGVRIELDLSWMDGGRGDVSSIVIEGTSGVARLTGLFGFSPERRLETQRCSLTGNGRTIASEFTPGPALQRAAFGATVAQFSRFCRGESAPIASTADVRRVAEWIEDIGARASA
jgi:predicted dehydrogenase